MTRRYPNYARVEPVDGRPGYRRVVETFGFGEIESQLAKYPEAEIVGVTPDAKPGDVYDQGGERRAEAAHYYFG